LATWFAELPIGFLSLLFGTALWHGLGIGLGWTTLDPANFTTILWVLALLVPWCFSGLIQSLLSVALVIKNAAEGLHTRGAPSRTRPPAPCSSLSCFSPSVTPRLLHHASSASCSAAPSSPSSTCTPETALSIGALGGANYTNEFVFTTTTGGLPRDGVQIFHVSQSFPDAVAVVAETNLPVMLLTYLLAVGWFTWHRDGLTILPALTEWRPRPDTPQN